MESFEDIGVPPVLVESLAASGIESPTALQRAAMPVVRRGNNVVLAAGPGAGMLHAWGVPLLERVSAGAGSPAVWVVTSAPESAVRLAESLAEVAELTDHVIAALKGAWSDPATADVLFGTAADLLAAADRREVRGDDVQAVVIVDAPGIAEIHGLTQLEELLQHVPSTAQRVMSALPVTPEMSKLAERHLRRAVVIPTPADAEQLASPRRGRIEYVVASEPLDEAALEVAAELLAAGSDHVLAYCRDEDRAADVGDLFTTRGFDAGAPGDADTRVWLGVDALAARDVIDESAVVAVLSVDVPADPDALDRRHGLRGDGVVLVRPRELPHLRDVAQRTGYELAARPGASRPDALDPLERMRARITRALAEEDVAPYLAALEPLFEQHGAAEIAAAATALLRKAERREGAPAPAAPPPEERLPAPGPAWAKLFVSVGERDGLRPGDLLGAITGEADVAGDAVGRIEIRENHSVVEVHASVATGVIRALNGTSLKGRAVRADFDRPRKGGAGPKRRLRRQP